MLCWTSSRHEFFPSKASGAKDFAGSTDPALMIPMHITQSMLNAAYLLVVSGGLFALPLPRHHSDNPHLSRSAYKGAPDEQVSFFGL